MRYPHIQQHDEKDCGAACLSMICEFFGLKLPIAKLRDLIKVDNHGASIYGVVSGAEKLGINAEALEGNPDELFQGLSDGEIKLPFIARIVNENMFEHYIVVYSISNGEMVIGDPGKAHISKCSVQLFIEQWQGQIITFEPGENFKPGNERKGAFKKFFRYITVQKKMLALVFVLSLLVSLVNISGSFIFQYVTEAVISTADTEDESEHNHSHESEEASGTVDKLIESLSEKCEIVFKNIDTVCISIILLYIFRIGVQVLRGYMLALTAKKVDIPLTMNYYNHLVNLPAEFFGTRKTGEFMSRFYDTAKIREAVSTATLTVMLDTIMAVACGIYLFCINSQLFVVTVVFLVLYAVVMLLFKRPIKKVNHELMENEAQVTSYLKESIDGMETLKAYCYENNAINKTDKLYNKLADSAVKGSFIYNMQETFVDFIASAGVVILLWVGTYLCISDIISIADLFTFYYLISFFLTPVQNLINLQPQLQTAVVAGERLNDILDAETENIGNKKKLECIGDIEIKDVNFRYGNRPLVLENINMKIQKGQKIAIVGQSGCGKTTISRLLLSFYEPSAGTVMVDGKNLSDYSAKSVRERIAYISQNVFLFSDTIQNNIKLGNESATDEEVHNVCDICMVDDFVEKMPMGYNTVLEENGSNLSGGQKQRIAIARALLRKPDLLIMDEATSNLDSITEENIRKTIDKVSENVTCVIIAHRLKTIENCDYIYVMENGKIIEQGTYNELVSKNGLFLNYLKS